MPGRSTAFNQHAGFWFGRAMASLAGVAGAGLLAACAQPPTPAAPASPSAAPPASPAPPSLAGWVRYSEPGFSIAAPSGFTPDPSHDYQALGPGKDIKGFALTIPAGLAKGTNLADDSYVAVETLRGTSPCTAAPFLDGPISAPSVTTNAITYSVATASDAGAGNLYDETVFAVQGASPCLAVRYFIHSLNIGNFTPGAVTAFDRAGLIARFDAIRATLRVEPAER